MYIIVVSVNMESVGCFIYKSSFDRQYAVHIRHVLENFVTTFIHFVYIVCGNYILQFVSVMRIQSGTETVHAITRARSMHRASSWW